MIEYAILKTGKKGFKKNQTDIEEKLNIYARKGWRVVCCDTDKIILDRVVNIKNN